jgi:undecaprenyl-diphosphatase
MKNKKDLWLSIAFLASFILWTLLISFVDVQPIGPRGSVVGFATINGMFHNLTGVHMTLYHITDWLGLVPVAFGFGFAILGLVQWIKRKHILKVDYSILVLGGYYVVVLAAYLFFEEVVLNYRPVLIAGFLEASYPSSTTLLVLCVMPTANMQLNYRIKNCNLRRIVSCAIKVFNAFMVIGRLVSGVHWLSDIIGGILLSAGLVVVYRFLSNLKRN